MKYNLSKILVSVSLLGIFVVIGVNSVEAATVNVTSPTSLTTGLVGWWTMDGPNMLTNVKDSSGNNNNGFMSGFTSTSTAVVPGKIGQGLKFDGVNDYVDAGTTFTDTGSFSVSLWVKSNTTSDMVFFEKANDNNYIAQISGSYVADVVTTVPSPTQPRSTNGSVSVGKWVHLVEVFNNNTQTLTLYNNGVGAAPTATGSTVRTASPFTTFIGKYKTGTFTSGSIDDVRIYNRALSATEVKQLYNTTVGSKQAASPNVTATSTCSTGLSCGLIAYWTMDGANMSGGALRDQSGSANTINLANISTSTFYTAGKIGQAFSFDGVNDYMKTASTINFGGTKIITTSFWFKENITTGTIGMELSSDYNQTGNDGTFIFNPNSSAGRTSVGIQDGVGASSKYRVESFSHPTNNTTWHHYSLIFDNSTNGGDITVYVDGVAQSTTIDFNSKDQSTAFKTDTLYFMSRGGTTFFNKGSLDDVRIYNRALSAGEILQLYNTTVGSKQAASPNVTATSTCSTGLSCGLVGYWTFDGPTMLTNVKDVSGSNNNGSMSGFTSTSTAVVAGKVGQGLKFDGVNDYVNIPHSSSFSISGSPLTVSFWAKPSRAGGFLGKQSASYSFDGYTISVDTNGALVIDINGDSATTRTSATTPLSFNKWHFIVVQITVHGSVQGYVDGVNAINSTDTSTVVSESNPVRVGISYQAGSSYLNGGIDDVRIYNRALSTTEIRQLYNLGK